MVILLISEVQAVAELPCETVDIEMYCLKDTYEAFFKTADIYKDAVKYCYPSVPKDASKCLLKEAKLHEMYKEAKSVSQYKIKHDLAATRCAICVSEACKMSGKPCVKETKFVTKRKMLLDQLKHPM